VGIEGGINAVHPAILTDECFVKPLK
jgi:hypothetical protein